MALDVPELNLVRGQPEHLVIHWIERLQIELVRREGVKTLFFADMSANLGPSPKPDFWWNSMKKQVPFRLFSRDFRNFKALWGNTFSFASYSLTPSLFRVFFPSQRYTFYIFKSVGINTSKAVRNIKKIIQETFLAYGSVKSIEKPPPRFYGHFKLRGFF